MAELELRELHLAFGGLKVLDGVSFALESGELLALIGPNGAGKTSVLNCICGIYRPTGGEVFFRGAHITGARAHAVARLGIARTFQHGELLPHLSVLDNLLVGRHTRLTTSFIEQQHLGLEGERPGEADDLLRAEAERADGLMAITFQLDEFEDPLRRLALRALLGARRGQEKRLPNEAGREPRVPADEEIVEHA